MHWIGSPDGLAWAAAGAALFVFLAQGVLETRRPLGEGENLRRALRAQGLSPWWVLASATAAVVEEFAYRGVLFLLLCQALPPSLAALGSALVCGLGHFSQGPRGAVWSMVFALVLQGVVLREGGLSLAIAVHFLYDVGAAWWGSRVVPRDAGPP